jgi:hypothetical protein
MYTFFMLLINYLTINCFHASNFFIAATMKNADECLLKSHCGAGRLKDLVLGMPKNRKDLIHRRGWGNLLEVGSLSAPEGLLEWIIDRINPDLGEFRNPHNSTSILFTKDMFVKVLGLPFFDEMR